MSELRVYDSNGTQIYPDSGKSSTQSTNYFSGYVFTMGAASGSRYDYRVTTYVKFDTESRSGQQLVLTFDTNEALNLLSEFKRVVQQELISGKGWQITEPKSSNDEINVFWEAVWQSDENRNKYDSVFDFYIREVVSLEKDARVIDNGYMNETIKIVSRTYRDIGKIIPLYQKKLSTEGTIVNVSRKRRGALDVSDVNFTIKTDQYEKFALDQETRRNLEASKEQFERDQKERALDKVEQQIQKADQLGVSADKLKNRIINVFDNSPSYAGITIIKKDKLTELENKASSRNRQQRGQRVRQTPNPGNRERLGNNTLKDKLPSVGKRNLAFVGLILLALIFAGLYIYWVGPLSGGGETTPENSDANLELDFATDPPETVTVGDNETISVRIETNETVDGENTIEFIWNGSKNQTETASIGLSGSETVEFDIPTNDTGNFTYTIQTESSRSNLTGNITVIDQRDAESGLNSLQIAGQGEEAIITEGADEDVVVEVENIGDQDGEFDVDLDISGEINVESTAELEPGDTENVIFRSITDTLNAGDYDVEVSTDNDTLTGELTVNAPANFEVTIDNVEDEVTEGETITVEYTIENTGDVEDTQDIEFEVNSRNPATEEGVTLDGGESFSGEFVYETEEGDSLEVTVEVLSEDDSDSTDVTIQ